MEVPPHPRAERYVFGKAAEPTSVSKINPDR